MLYTRDISCGNSKDPFHSSWWWNGRKQRYSWPI